MSNLPRGFKFHPSDESLISSYLLRKTLGRPLPWNGILEAPVYAMEPWDAFRDIINQESPYWEKTVTWHDDDRIKNVKQTIYVFANLTRVGRVSRKAGCGTWKGQTGPKKITRLSDGQHIGSSRMYSFTLPKNVNPPEEYKNHQWVMHEYCLEGSQSDLVLCKINISYSPSTVQIPRENSRTLGSSTTTGISEDVYPVQVEDEGVQIPSENYGILGSSTTRISEDVYPVKVVEDVQIPTENWNLGFEENKRTEMYPVCRSEISMSLSKNGSAEVQVEGDAQIPSGNDIPISLSKKRPHVLG